MDVLFNSPRTDSEVDSQRLCKHTDISKLRFLLFFLIPWEKKRSLTNSFGIDLQFTIKSHLMALAIYLQNTHAKNQTAQKEQCYADGADAAVFLHSNFLILNSHFSQCLLPAL